MAEQMATKQSEHETEVVTKEVGFRPLPLALPSVMVSF